MYSGVKILHGGKLIFSQLSEQRVADRFSKVTILARDASAYKASSLRYHVKIVQWLCRPTHLTSLFGNFAKLFGNLA